MKKFIKCFILFFCLLLLFNIDCFAKEKVKIYFFHGDGCPHCEEEEKFLDKISAKYKNDVEIIDYEVWKNEDNALFMKDVGERFDVTTNAVPLTVISSTPIVGFSDTTEAKIKRAINYYLENDKKNIDYVSKIKNNSINDTKKIKDEFSLVDQKTDSSSTINLFLIGKINLKDLSLPTAAATIGLVDGFNPCAMWVLLFLISMLMGMKNKKRMWLLGVSFLVTSALVYMAIMLSWFNIIVNVMASVIFRNIIAVVAIIGSVINLKSYFKSSDSGCEVVDSKKRKKIITKIKKFTTEKSLVLSLIGVIGLAISVNVIELACSAGLPLVFTQILALNKVSGFETIFYTLIYIIFFLIDDIVVFSVAMLTTKINTVSTKYNKYSHLVGGLIMLAIGILLILKPEWLMFNFS